MKRKKETTEEWKEEDLLHSKRQKMDKEPSDKNKDDPPIPENTCEQVEKR